MAGPKWMEGGAFTSTMLATLLSLLAAPIGGLGIIALVFGGWMPSLILVASGVILWVTGRRLVDR